MFRARHAPFASAFACGAAVGICLGVTAASRPPWLAGARPAPAAAASTALPGHEAPVPVPDAAQRVQGRTPLAGTYRARVLGVIDGDTIEARVHVWMGQEVVARVRLRDIDAPELNSGCAEERQRAVAARERLAGFIGSGAVTLADVQADKYFGRVVARVSTVDGADAGAMLLAERLARVYGGGRRMSWCVSGQAP
jgi:endonuclease YncB( thermonuclease family)